VSASEQAYINDGAVKFGRLEESDSECRLLLGLGAEPELKVQVAKVERVGL
jgi:hypothetical protein